MKVNIYIYLYVYVYVYDIYIIVYIYIYIIYTYGRYCIYFLEAFIYKSYFQESSQYSVLSRFWLVHH